MEKANGGLNMQLTYLQEKVSQIEKSSDEEKKRADALEEELGKLRQAEKDAVAENEGLKAEVQKEVEEIVSALGDGYSRCLERVSKSGFSIEGHSFADYIYATTQHLSTSKVVTQLTLGILEDGECPVVM